MNSTLKEQIDFCTTIDPFDDERNPRNVEEWLLQVEIEMQAAIKFQMYKAVGNFDPEERPKWLLDYPS